jgi:SEC-C motif
VAVPNGLRDAIMVTGGDRPYFLMICALMQSLRASGHDVLVLDFGLGEPEQAFLRRKDALLDRPAHVVGSPLVLKTALGEYLAAVSADWPAAVWLDADMLVDGNISGELAALLDAMIVAGATVAACPDTAGTIRKVVSDQRLNFAPFVAALTLRGFGLDEPYYNNGFAVFRSKTLLRKWYQLAIGADMHTSIDQNFLNIVIREDGNVITPLDPGRWNVHGEHLASAKRDGTPRIFHPTSYAWKYHHEIWCGFGTEASYVFKFFRDPDLARLQFQMLSNFLESEQRALRDAGVIAGTEMRLKWAVSRNAPCPCGSGRRYKHCHGQLARASP